MDIHVSSLPFKIKKKDLIALFEQYGEVSACVIIIDNITRQSKGFGFVTMPNEKEAFKAIQGLHKQRVMNRELEVSRSEKKQDLKKVEAKTHKQHGRPKLSPKALEKIKAVKSAKKKKFEEKRANMKTSSKKPRHKKR